MLGNTGFPLHMCQYYLSGLIRRGPLCTGKVPEAMEGLSQDGVVWLLG